MGCWLLTSWNLGLGELTGAVADVHDTTVFDHVVATQLRRSSHISGLGTWVQPTFAKAPAVWLGQHLRTHSKPTARQLYLAGLIYTPVKVDRWGRVMLDTWTYGGPDTQSELLPYHITGQHILLGRDPDDFSLPALAWNAKNELICEGIMPVARGAYGSVDGIRDAARNRKAARVAVRAAAEANSYLSNAEFEAAMAAIPTPDAPTTAPEAVVAGRFAGSLKLHKAKAVTQASAPAVPLEYMKNFDAYIAESAAGRKPKLA